MSTEKILNYSGLEGVSRHVKRHLSEKLTQVTSIPEETPATGQIVQWIGETTSNYKNGFFYKYNGTSWEEISVSAAEEITIDNEISNISENPVQNKVIKTALDEKVDKITGKGLSTNDYTTAEKTKLENIEDYAEVNTIDKITVNGVDVTDKTVALTIMTNTVNNLTNYYKKTETYTQEEINNLISAITTLDMKAVTSLPTTNISTTTIYLLNKTVGENQNIKDEYINLNGTTSGWELIGTTEIDLSGYALKTDIPTKTSNLTNDSNFVVDSNYVHTDNNYTTEEKTKLTGIASGAEVNQNAFSNIRINNSSGTSLGTLSADSKTDTAIIQAGNNITLTADTTNDKVTISATDTNTHRPIQVNSSQILGNTTTALNLVSGTNMSLSSSNGAVTFNSTATKIWYGVCTTDSDISEKVVTCSGFTLATGVIIIVNFSDSNSVSSPTLNVNSTGAKTIIGSSSTITPYYWVAWDSVIFRYTGSYWQVLNYVNKTSVGLGNVDNTADADKTVNKANTLTTARYIDGISFDGSGDVNHFGTCSTTASTTAKVVSVTGSPTLANGTRIIVRFQYANTASNPTLNVNSLGAKPIKLSNYSSSGSNAGSTTWGAGYVLEFVFANNYWIVIRGENATTSYDGLMSAADKTKLNGIASGAEVNVQSDWNVTTTTSDAYIKNKPTSLPANGGNADTVGNYSADNIVKTKMTEWYTQDEEQLNANVVCGATGVYSNSKWLNTPAATGILAVFGAKNFFPSDQNWPTAAQLFQPAFDPNLYYRYITNDGTGTGAMDLTQSWATIFNTQNCVAGKPDNTNGYMKFVNGLCLQWGYNTGKNANTTGIYFPYSYSQEDAEHSVSVIVQPKGVIDETIRNKFHLYTVSYGGFSVHNTSSTSINFYWIAIGWVV